MTIQQGAIDELRRRIEQCKSQSFPVTAICIDIEKVEEVTNAAERCIRLEAVLRRIRDWDHLDGAADGPYWKREMDEALKEQQ